MVGIEKRIKAFTLVESLVAMVLVVFSMGFATVVYVNVVDSDRQLKQQRAILILDKYALETKEEKQFIDDLIKLDDYYIEKTLEKYANTENLYLFKLVLLDLNKNRIYSRSELILIE
jgi:type II secretory pathway pseudopilin PulG